MIVATESFRDLGAGDSGVSGSVCSGTVTPLEDVTTDNQFEGTKTALGHLFSTTDH
jgi:hypothetical protein